MLLLLCSGSRIRHADTAKRCAFNYSLEVSLTSLDSAPLICWLVLVRSSVSVPIWVGPSEPLS